MKTYIFITDEGYTYQPNSNSPEPDTDNCQVIGFAKGNNQDEAFANLIKDNEYLLDTNFNKIIALELKNEDYHSQLKCFYLDDRKDFVNELTTAIS